MTERRTRPWHLYMLTAIGVVLLVLALTQIGPPNSSARTSTQIVTAQNGVVQSTVTGTGNVEAGTDLNVNFQTSGTLSAVYVQVGQHVNKGQLLATLDSTTAQLTLDQAESQLTAAQDQLSSAESGTSTSTGGSSAGSSATSSGSSTTSATSSAGSIASAQAAVDSAQAAVDSAQTALNDTKLYAPVGGTIASLAGLSPGDSVSAGTSGSTSGSSSASTAPSPSTGSSATTAGGLGSGSSSSSSTGSSSSPFAQIVNTSTMTMTVAFSESDVNKLKVGQAATVTPDALSGVELGAHVTSISPVGTTSSNVVSYPATLTLDQNDSSVKPGMSASTSVIVAQAQGVNVPNAAVSGTGSLATVTVMRNGKQTQQQVVVGLRGDSRTQIISGLSAGEQVVIKTTLPPPTSATTGTASSTGTLGGAGARPGGGIAGGGFGGGGFGGGAGGAGRAGATGSAG
jgi:multidrug efflux pump subunit AcrA (membrane-fusion protein)